MASLQHSSTYCVGTHGLGFDFFELADLSEPTLQSIADEVSPEQAEADRKLFDRVSKQIAREEAQQLERDRELFNRVSRELGR